MVANKTVVNAANLASGGAYTILRNFYCNAPSNSIFIVKNKDIVNKLKVERADGPDLVIPPVFFTKPWGLFFFYFWWVGHFCKKINACELLSLGNIAARTKINQKIYLHWPYFAYGISAGGKSNFILNLKRTVRYQLIRFFSVYPAVWVVQTEAMKSQLLRRHGKKLDSQIFAVYPGFEKNSLTSKEIKQSKNKTLHLIYPALFYSHKNFEIILDVAQIINEKNLDILISLTLPAEIYKNLGFEGKKCMRNLGILSQNEMQDAYQSHDALFMPTKLETFGLPYLEALSYGLPILTSDKDFSRDICCDYAIYFSPDSPAEIINSFKVLKDQLLKGRDFHTESSIQLARFSSWADSVTTVFNIESK